MSATNIRHSSIASHGAWLLWLGIVGGCGDSATAGHAASTTGAPGDPTGDPTGVAQEDGTRDVASGMGGTETNSSRGAPVGDTGGAATGGMAPSGTSGSAPVGTSGTVPSEDAGTATNTDAGATPETSSLPACEGGDPGPCGSFVTSAGSEVALGPYGALMDLNVGESHAIAGEGGSSAICPIFAASFGADADDTDALLDTDGLDFTLFTVYRPATPMEGETYPVLTWGNGTCAQPEGYGALLRYMASHGFIVVAANHRFVGSGAAQRAGIDYILAENERSDSPLFGIVDTENVGAFGHSQGAAGTAAAAADSRIDVVILYNGGTGDGLSQPVLALSGDRDIGGGSASSYGNSVTSAGGPAAWIWYHMIPGNGSSDGHLTLMTQPERVIEPSVAWFKYHMSGDAASRDYFVQPACLLCGNDSDYEYGSAGLP